MTAITTGETVQIVHACDCDLEAEIYPNDHYCDHGIRWPALAAALHALIPEGGKRDFAFLGVALEMPAADIEAALRRAILQGNALGLALEGSASGLLATSYVVSVYRPTGIRPSPVYHAIQIIAARVSDLTVGEAAARLGMTPEALAALPELDGPWLFIEEGDGSVAERKFGQDGV